MLKFKNNAFTLAEVLITLGVIGVVAALTIPSLIGRYNRVVVSARNKKFVSTINQAVLRSTVDNEAPNTWLSSILYHDADSLYDWFDTYIMQYVNVLKNCRENSRACIAEYKYCQFPESQCSTAGAIASSSVLYVFNDGSMITAITGGGLDSETGLTTGLTLHIRYDMNGYAKPNIFGRDIFSYRFTINRNKFYMECDNHKSITGGSVSTNDSRESLIEACRDNPQTCSCLLMKDNYEVKEDYPFKL